MGKMTFVVEFEDGKEVPVHAGMDVAGGRLVAAAFFDYRVDFFKPEERDIITEALTNLECDDCDEDIHEEIARKAEMLTF